MAHQQLQAWHARMVVLAAAKPVRGAPAVLPAWQTVLTGLAQTHAVAAWPTPALILAEATRWHADLLLVVLRVREASREKHERRTLLQSPIPVLLLPLIG